MEDDVRDFKRRKIQDLDQKRAHKGDSPAAKEAWVKAVKDIKDIDTAIRNGAKTLAEVKTAIIQNASLVAEINKELGIAEEIVVTEETVVEPEQTSDGGVFSARLEALISAALQDGVLTEQEKAILKKRVEKEAEDWDEVEMIINARLSEMQPALQPKNNVKRNAVCEKDKDVTPSPPPMETKLEMNVPILDDPIFNPRKVGVSRDINVTIPEGYTEITEGFSNSLQSLILPSTLKRIGDEAFIFCEKLKKMDLSNCTALQEIGNKAFNYCHGLEEVILPDSIEIIGDDAFADCEKLKKIDLSNCTALKKIGEDAFYCCGKLKKIDFSNCTALQEIGNGAFVGCGLEEVILPDSIKKIGDGAFGGWQKLEKIVMPASLEELGEYVFKGCDSLEEVDMSKVTKLTTINKGFISGNDEQVIIPMGVTTIKKDALDSCNLYELFLPPTLKNYKDTNGSWNSVYLFAPPLAKLDNIFENSDYLYVLPQYLEEYRSIYEALGEYTWCEIHPMPDEYLYFYDN